jgi:Tfp pilus assembly protein PilN
MRPVNLLPARYRPRTGASADSKTSYIALGVLGLLVLAVLGYVMTANSANSRTADIAETQQRIQAAEAKAVTLKGFGDFAGVKEARLGAVKALATERLDWERLFRELAHVLPNGVWLTQFNGKATAASGAGAGNESSIMLTGCAGSHAQIADVMVRLRELHVAEEVELTKTSASEQTEDSAGASPVAPAGAPAAGASEGGEGCGPYYNFDINITVAAAAPDLAADGAEPVPARLGGGE